jgi:hypothetical protein
MVEAAVDASAVTALPAKDTIAVAVAGIEGVHTRSSPKFVGSESAPNRVSAAAPAERVPSCAAGEEVTAAPTDEAAAGSARNERVATGAATDLTAASIVREHIVGTPPSMDEHLAGTTLKRLGRPAHAGRPGQVERHVVLTNPAAVTEKDDYVERRLGDLRDVVLAQGDLGGQARAAWPGGERKGTGRITAAFTDKPSAEIGRHRDRDVILLARRCSVCQRHIDELLGGHAHGRGLDGRNPRQRSRRHREQSEDEPNPTAHLNSTLPAFGAESLFKHFPGRSGSGPRTGHDLLLGGRHNDTFFARDGTRDDVRGGSSSALRQSSA